MGRARAASIIGRLLQFAGGLALAAFIVGSYGGNDFAHYYLSSRLLLEGRVPYGVSLAPLAHAAGLKLDAGVQYGTDTPVFLLLFGPLAALPPLTAYYLWALVQLASLGCAVVLSLRLVEGRLSPQTIRLLAGGTVVAFSVWDHFLYSQTQLLLLALVLVAFVLSRSRRHAAALLLVTAAGLLKLYPLALLPWFAARAHRERGWRAFLPSVLAGGAAVLGTARLWEPFVRLGLPHVATFVGGPFVDLSLTGMVVELLRATTGTRLTAGAVRLLWAVLAAAVLGAAYLRIRTRAIGEERELGVLLCALVVAVPVAWTHYLVLTIPAFYLLAADVAERPGPVALAALAGAYLCTVGAFDQMVPRLMRLEWGVQLALGALTTLAVLALGTWLSRLRALPYVARRPRTAVPGGAPAAECSSGPGGSRSSP